MKIITLYRKDFIKTAEADFFADICIKVGAARSYEEAEEIEELALYTDGFNVPTVSTLAA